MSRFHYLRYGDLQRPGGNVLWPIEEGRARWAYSVEFEEVGEKLECVSVTVSAAPTNNEQALTAEAFRVPIATIIAIARARLEPEERERRRQTLLAEEAVKAERWRTQYGMDRPPARIGWEEVSGSGRGGFRESSGRRPLERAFLERVAEVFTAALKEGRPPAKAVREVISAERGAEVSQDTVDGWIRKARQRAVLTLPPARSGTKAG